MFPRLSKLQAKVKDRLLLIPRVYTNKPRTLGTGYKGMLHRPNVLGEDDMLEGLIRVRQMHIRVIEETGLTSADEILYPDYYRYFSDLLSYAAVGARSTENQQHRFISSGLDIPVGMKNPTGEVSKSCSIPLQPLRSSMCSCIEDTKWNQRAILFPRYTQRCSGHHRGYSTQLPL
ncbi:MAG: hypothetical protein V8Q42_02555 [Anaerovoracaceae bacterium]